MYNGSALAATMPGKNPCKVLRSVLPQMKRECKLGAEKIALKFTFPVKMEESGVYLMRTPFWITAWISRALSARMALP